MAIVRSKSSVVIPEDEKSFPRFMLKKFEEYGNNTAIVDSKSNRSYTYRQLISLIKKCGSGLLRAGLKPRETIALILPNVPEYPIIVYGATSVGVIVTTLNPSYTVDEFVYQLRDSEATHVVTIPQLSQKVKEAASKLNIKSLYTLGEADGFMSMSTLIFGDNGSLFQFYEPRNWREEVLYLPYSSGTTGHPKGVMLTHFNLIAHKYQISQGGLTVIQTRVMLGLMPFFHSYGLGVMLGAGLFFGYNVVCINGFEPASFLKAIQDYKISTLTIVPPIAVFLAKHPIVLKYDLKHVEAILCGAAPLGEDANMQLKRRFPKVKFIRQGYGMTETSPSLMTQPPDKVKIGSVGMLLPNIEAKVINLETGALLGPGQDGEICVRGPNIMKGYHNKRDATMTTIDQDGWLHTGDIGHYDEDEHFFIVDRVKELIKYKGFQVPPAQIEDILLSHPQITDAAVIGIPNEEAGELPKAFVVTKAKLTEQDIIGFVSKKVAPHKKLRGGVEFVESIPKNPSGKILRRQLREQEKKKLKSLKHKL
ncbi:probable 4-coumarate--CoA ligase 3 [Exaiptasia diaphana]|uniref:Luciferin 4-monooxygenase n=1 Tax=Exaiptasia diaphana TaxID=2652724 RepID=A0A913WP27_EXADI|nr:probable 4-coumarate--CoA ligase 3 [Exaiptasia diaphana]KXJ19143.1 4-coumarate--CoA ligase 1 [Exaiptasia diaphana]